MDVPYRFLLIIILKTSESCRSSNAAPKNVPINFLSVLVKNVDEGISNVFNKSKDHEVNFHVGDKCRISCEQTSKQYTLSWTQQADDALISFPPYLAKKITLNINLDRFDHKTVFKCTAFVDGQLNDPVFDISFRVVNSEINSSLSYPDDLKIDTQCSPVLGQGQPYAIIDEKLHHYNRNSTNTNTTKVCIYKDIDPKNDTDVYITRRVTYMSKPKPKYKPIKFPTETPATDNKRSTTETSEKDSLEQDEVKSFNKNLWMAVSGAVAALTIFLIIIIIWKRKRKPSREIATDPLYATAQDVNRVVYAELDVARGVIFSRNREEVAPYTQVIGVLKKKKKT